MGNKYTLEYELLKKSRLTNRAPSSLNYREEKEHLYGFDSCKCGCKESSENS